MHGLKLMGKKVWRVDEYFPEQEQSLTVEREVSSEGFVQDIQKGLKQSVRVAN